MFLLLAVATTGCGDEPQSDFASHVVIAMGSNQLGLIGNGEEGIAITPYVNMGLNNIEDVDIGSYHAMALTKSGIVFTWGQNTDGVLGVGEGTDMALFPVKVEGLPEIQRICTNYSKCLALDRLGNVWKWGVSGSGVWVSYDYTPVNLNLINIVDISCGINHCLALDGDGNVFSWGVNTCGQLGDGTLISREDPAIIDGLPEIVDIACGRSHSLALSSEGEVYSWGCNNSDQLGNCGDTYCTLPAVVPGLENITAVFAGPDQSFVADSARELLAWGNNTNFQLGINKENSTEAEPTRVPWLSDVIDLDSHGTATIALTADGMLYQWGRCYFDDIYRIYGRILYPAPDAVESFSGLTAIANGQNCYLAVKEIVRPDTYENY